MERPNFIGIGAQRAGTTWLYANLRQHPDVFLPETKELRYFNFGYEHGENSYLSHFAGSKGETAVGEITPGYYWNRLALQRIAAFRPDMKLIFIVRAPVERAYSQYELYRDEFAGESFSEALRARPELVDWGRYGRTLGWLDELFPPEQLLVLDYSELQEDPRGFFRRVLEFLDVDRDFVPSGIEQRVNKVIFPRLQGLLQAAGMAALVDWIKATPVGDRIRSAQAPKRPYIALHDREYIADSLRDDVHALERRLGRDFGGWFQG